MLYKATKYKLDIILLFKFGNHVEGKIIELIL